MGDLKYVKHEKLSLKNHPQFDETWVQKKISEDPAILGLGELVLRDKERIQPRAGRLDILLQDTESDRRYEVEIMLGATDESHIIRTIEYWDIERKRFPQYDHCAVIVAEDITSRFLNVISLFNGSIPLIAIQMSAIKIGEHVTLFFTTVLDELTLGHEDEEENALEVTDRNYWETKRGTKETVALADELLAIIKNFAPMMELKYNKSYIGLTKSGKPDNFVTFVVKKKYLSLEPRILQSDEISKKLEATELTTLSYDKQWRRYRIMIKSKEDINVNKEALEFLMKMAFEQGMK